MLKIARYALLQSRLPFKPRSKEGFEREAPKICLVTRLYAQTGGLCMLLKKQSFPFNVQF